MALQLAVGSVVATAPRTARQQAVRGQRRHVPTRSTRLVVRAVQAPPPAPSPSSDWRAKEAERLRIQEESRKRTAEAKAAYDQQQAALRGDSEIPPELQTPLAELSSLPFVDEEGCIADCSEAGARATVYAVLDEHEAVQYIGVTRAINPSLKLHMARRPKLCHHVKLLHLARPSRAMLEAIRTSWLDQCGDVPGNDAGPEQNLWENPLDCKLYMTDEDRQHVESLPDGKEKDRALKVVARKFEAEIQEEIKARGITERFRFNPKLKDQGLLDLQS